MVLADPSLTSGRGSTVKKYKQTDWVRTLRHDVGEPSKILLVMALYSVLNDDDLRTVILYLKSLPSVNSPLKTVKLGFVGKLLVSFRTIVSKILKATHIAILKVSPTSLKSTVLMQR